MILNQQHPTKQKKNSEVLYKTEIFIGSEREQDKGSI